MNVELDREHYAKLLILVGLWRADSPDRFVEKYIEDTWEQLGEGIPEGDFTLEDFDRIAEDLLDLEV